MSAPDRDFLERYKAILREHGTTMIGSTTVVVLSVEHVESMFADLWEMASATATIEAVDQLTASPGRAAAMECLELAKQRAHAVLTRVRR